MNKSKSPVAGYVAFGTMYYEPENLRMISKRAEKQLIDAGLTLINTDAVYGEDKEPERAIKELKSQEWDFLFVNIMNWIDTRGVFRVLHEFRNEPMILYSLGGFTDHEGKFEEKGTVYREKALNNSRWTYKIFSTKKFVTLDSIENCPCLICPEVDRCFMGGQKDPTTCLDLTAWVDPRIEPLPPSEVKNHEEAVNSDQK